MMTPNEEPAAGTMSTCTMCGQPIEFGGQFWRHLGEAQPRHPSIPIADTTEEAPQHTSDLAYWKERAVRAEFAALRATADAAEIRGALQIAIEAIGTDMHYIPATDEQRMRNALAAEHPGADLLAERDQWRESYEQLLGQVELHLEILDLRQAAADLAGTFYDVVLAELSNQADYWHTAARATLTDLEQCESRLGEVQAALTVSEDKRSTLQAAGERLSAHYATLAHTMDLESRDLWREFALLLFPDRKQVQG